MRVVLIGPSGVGKTTVGRIVAKELGDGFYDMDCLLHEKNNFPEKENYSSLEKIEKKKLEIDILKNVLKKKHFVFSTCGGLIEEQFESNIKKIFDILNPERNVIMILPYQDMIMTKKFLMKRFGLVAVTKDMSLNFERDCKIFCKLAKVVVYTRDRKAEDIAKNVLEIIE